ncbi:MAG: shikimate kinase [Ruminococcaceae bacterium]|nr:shikimate kinase [Oscillospiraceae bacterium]
MRYGLLGEHLEHSVSPKLHRLLGDDSYELLEVAPQKLEHFLKTLNFDGINVTIPYKKAVVPYCNSLSESAQRIGCVNTLVRRKDGSLHGENTDYDGFLWLLERNGGIRAGEKALILGSGGASLTVQAVLSSFGAECIVVSRNGETDYVNYTKHNDAVLLVNTTPVGMYPDNGNCLVNLAALPHLRCVLDLVYNPLKTELLLQAERLGIPCENGLSMLVGQGVAARRLWTGKTCAQEEREQILCKLSSQMRNIILIGMPGCGKSSVGRLLAQKTGREFYDSDAWIEEKYGPIPTFFAQFGEEAFRNVETEALRALSAKTGCVIATGGGCVMREENLQLLRQNGRIIWLQRPTNELSTENRPISQSTDLDALYALRRPLYEKFADMRIENVTAEQAALEIMEEFI